MSVARPPSRLAHLAPGVGRLLRRAVAGGARAPRPRTLLALAGVLMLAIVGWLWLRDSSLVAVREVEVTGIDRAQGARVRAALEEAARSMTTLHVRQDALETAVAPFSIVKGVEVQSDFPHTLRIHVVTNTAVGAVVIDGRRIPVTSDGTLLRDVTASARLPTIPLQGTPGGRRLTDPLGRLAVATLAAAPAPLRTRVSRVSDTRAHGLTVQLAHGPALWFGDGTRLAAKWAAAAAVLADPAAAGASAIDVTVPERPAVGGLPDGASATGESDVPTPPPGSTTPAASPSATATTSAGTPAAGTTTSPPVATTTPGAPAAPAP